VVQRIKQIGDMEGMVLNREMIVQMVESSANDIRQLINNLQVLKRTD
jgi:DNA polymerase III delta prime subunit